MKTLFLGNRMMLEVGMEMPDDDFIAREMEFRKMISLIKL